MSVARPLHLAKYMHDVTCQVTEIWCDASRWMDSDATEDIGRASCLDCLEAASNYGDEANSRRMELRAAQILDPMKLRDGFKP